ncbi:PAK-box/P21-Rho-binding protein [Corchorus capsularis]|uniref:PAK-box/P21-Rho-binding protein n=1 Tax=Corchorus capsularis TaxID=210143 RepID=A0A1R3K5X3_COCAP|nr:PAK-box/P21-Rho-binding protein [Corchorus capsularis]
MEISWPTNVRHVAHVTFDRFNGFLGLPVEFEPEVPRRAPSASATVFGVSTESMQLSYDSRGNSVPMILLLMQRRLYAQGGLQAEGIFRINAENSQEEYVREQLNGGVVPEGIDVHCLAGLIKAWFRELPNGVLDSLSQEQVMQCQTEEQCAELARLLPPTESALLDWAINLMADVVQQEHLNKMNARNIAMVFAPNMTQMADPLTALMYAVQVMNFLKTLILRTLREREDSVVEPTLASRLEPFDENGDQSHSLSCIQDAENDNEEKELAALIAEKSLREHFRNYNQKIEITDGEEQCPIPSVHNVIADADDSDETPAQAEAFVSETTGIVANHLKPGTFLNAGKSNFGQSSNSSPKKVPNKIGGQQSILQITNPVEKTLTGISNLSRIDSRIERIEAWR